LIRRHAARRDVWLTLFVELWLHDPITAASDVCALRVGPIGVVSSGSGGVGWARDASLILYALVSEAWGRGEVMSLGSMSSSGLMSAPGRMSEPGVAVGGHTPRRTPRSTRRGHTGRCYKKSPHLLSPRLMLAPHRMRRLASI
jgi:hypothetical protein